jgi:transcription initiation factor TFIIIB Brf1 subunit/transcription initiation factor TFIIB
MSEAEPPRDVHPPICPACGVTKLLSDDDEPEFVCLECGFSDDEEPGG